jgi:hypothetical protein
MQTKTAQNIVKKLRANEPVKLRGTKTGGISSITWCFICDILFSENPRIVDVTARSRYSKTDERRATIHAYNNKGEIVLVADKITLY